MHRPERGTVKKRRTPRTAAPKAGTASHAHGLERRVLRVRDALGARAATNDARLGLPEGNLGPGLGGSDRAGNARAASCRLAEGAAVMSRKTGKRRDKGSPMQPGQSCIAFARLTAIPLAELIAHMSDPRVALHMPLLTPPWDLDTAARFVAAKEDCWRRDGLGHWAILRDGRYVGWGGFQKEGAEWDFGLVLRPEAFGMGWRIASEAIALARADPRIPFVTFLLPPSRRNLGALARLGATVVGEVELGGAAFLKFRLETD